MAKNDDMVGFEGKDLLAVRAAVTVVAFAMALMAGILAGVLGGDFYACVGTVIAVMVIVGAVLARLESKKTRAEVA